MSFVVSTVICFMLGALSWHLVERPMLKLKRKAMAPLAPDVLPQTAAVRTASAS
jgi:peptidoglycan/LPS O-acetylase OafA/YrhL